MRNQYHHAKIEEIIEHNENTRSFILDVNFKSVSGQFAMVWLPGIDEKPFSLSGPNMITVKKVGPFTEKLFEKTDGYLDVRGPYGNGFPHTAKNTAIGGGCGIAPLIHLLSDNFPSVTRFVLAGKTKSDLIFLEKIIETFKKSPSITYSSENVIAVTEDGSYGIKGLVTDVDIQESDYNYFMCGPEIMMKNVAEKLVKKDVNPERIYISMERYMKCAVGVCGNCSFSGYRVCADGPVFRYDKIKDLPHFNKYERTRTGELVEK